MRKFMRFVLILLVIAALGWGGELYFNRSSGQESAFRTTAIQRGDLLATISATATIEPQEVIDVGAQIAGLINVFGTDADGKTIDYGSRVKKDMVLAKIDDALYAADEMSAKSQVANANAGVTRAIADLAQMQAALEKAKSDWDRAQKAGEATGMLSEEQFDAYKAAYETAKANVGVGQASIEQAKSAIIQAQATLDRAEKNLGYCTISSPVDGVIIDRRVNIGQTVVASLNAPSLFLIAKDLTKLVVWASVNEADIGNIHPGQPATFTVDAFPGQTFKGTVSKVRLNASMTSNVVTYTVEIATDNSSGKLLPYLTANVQFEVDRRSDVLMVPNAALRWTPTDQQIAPDARDNTDETSAPATQRSPTSHPSGRAGGREHGLLWAKDGTFVRPLKVRIGLTDGTNTEVDSKDLTEGTEIVMGEIQPGEAGAAGGARNPFLPQFGNRRGGGGGGGGRRGG
ncbi:MAG TPA: efflux RND transporter periplasmic adaptor subunit [Tepidisphaeraceae bacterium]|jgi:HlyD family secretion protein|nr:efflux RND transporter periplasmic adaptor subunit [Tepidisphaeraceae bacterium]